MTRFVPQVDTAGASQPSCSSGEGRALKAPLSVPKLMTTEKSKDSLPLGSVMEGGEASLTDQVLPPSTILDSVLPSCAAASPETV